VVVPKSTGAFALGVAGRFLPIGELLSLITFDETSPRRPISIAHIIMALTLTRPFRLLINGPQIIAPCAIATLITICVKVFHNESLHDYSHPSAS
jgi:hypothetical protein